MMARGHAIPRPILILALLTFALVSAASRAQEQCPCPPPEAEPPEPLWKTSLGASYVATTGNTETTSFGSDLRAERRPVPWGIELFARYDRAEDGDTLQSERTVAGVRGKRSLGDRWELFGEVSGEKDEFAGFDLRLVAITGGTLHALRGPRHGLDFDLGLSWTDEDRIAPEEDVSFLGAVAGLDYMWKLSDSAAFVQRLTAFPNFDRSDAWRLESTSALEASLTGKLALRVGYEVRYQNLPIGEREDTDTTTRMSLVFNL